MIIDSSALIAVLLREEGFEVFDEAISYANACKMSAANFVEVSMVLESRTGSLGVRQFDSFLRQAGITIEAVTIEQAHLAREAFANFGKGQHPAGLNFGDCFSYALAKALDEPLLFKGEDFLRTDVIPAM